MKQVYSRRKNLMWLAVAVVLGMQAFNVLADSWSSGPGNTGFARWGATAITYPAGSVADQVSGYSGSAYTTTNRQFSPTPSVSYSNKLALAGIARTYATGFSIGANGYVGTGQNNSGNALSDLWQYNFTGNTWTQMASLPVARWGAVGFSIGGKGYIGTGVTTGPVYFNDFYEYDPVANAWTAKAVFPGSARSGAVGFSINTQGYIGTGQDASVLNNDFYQWDQASNTWTAKTSFPGSARQGAAGFSIASKGYIGTGYDGTAKNDFYEYDAVANTWAAKANFSGSARFYAIGFSIGGTGYIGTGTANGTTALQDLYAYTGDPFIYEYALSSSSYVVGSQINVSYATNLASGAVLTAQLSDASGSFASPVALGTITITASNALGTITGTIPGTQAVGSGYRVRVISGATTSNDNGVNFSVISPAHVTMSLQNVSQTAANNVQFDLMVVSDGDPASDLRANSFQYGVDYNTGILPTGTITVSYITSSSDFASMASSGSFTFPAPGVSGTLRIVGNPCSGCNTTANKLTVGHTYKVGRFQVTGSSNFVACTNTNFALVAAVVAGKTTTASILYVGSDANSTTSFDQTGTGNFQKSIGTVSNIALNCVTNVNVKLFIEGYYNASSHQMAPVEQNEGVVGAGSSQTDTIKISLISTSNTSTVVESHNAILATNGTASAAFSPSITGQTLWLAVYHRSALDTWSAAPVTFSGNTNYDFTTAASQAYGSNQSVQTDGAFTFYNGDINQDENIDLIDFPFLDYQIGQGLFGYYAGDLNGDGNVDLLDFPLFDGNLINGRYAQHP